MRGYQTEVSSSLRLKWCTAAEENDRKPVHVARSGRTQCAFFEPKAHRNRERLVIFSHLDPGLWTLDPSSAQCARTVGANLRVHLPKRRPKALRNLLPAAPKSLREGGESWARNPCPELREGGGSWNPGVVVQVDHPGVREFPWRSLARRTLLAAYLRSPDRPAEGSESRWAIPKSASFPGRVQDAHPPDSLLEVAHSGGRVCALGQS